MRLAFGECAFDGETHELFFRGAPVHLGPKAFRLLGILLERRPRAVSREELIETLWPKTFVTEGNLTRLVSEVRTAVGENVRRPRLIRTLHGFGYAFCAGTEPLSSSAPARKGRSAAFQLVWRDREIALGEGENVLGRDETSSARIDVGSVFRHHARIVVTGAKATLEDLGSKNGTFHRGKRVARLVALGDGDKIRIGTVPLTFRRVPSSVSTQTARIR